MKGATLHFMHFVNDADDFNPRTREGCDFMSSHAINSLPLDFNPCTREGCDMNLFGKRIINRCIEKTMDL